MAKQKKSAKDIAFDKERRKYSSEIRRLQREISQRDEQIAALKDKLQVKEDLLQQKEGRIQRLLTYTKLSEEEMQESIQKDKLIAEAIKSTEAMRKLIDSFWCSYKGEE